jgi:hypothetical protein
MTFAQTSLTTINDIQFKSEIKVNNKTLIINGGGLREKYLIDLYVATLYLPKKTTDANKIINADEEQAVYIRLVSNSVTRDRFKENVELSFSKATHGKWSKQDLAKFLSFFKEEFKKGDKIYIEYVPGKGLSVEQNGVLLGVIESIEFKKAMFSTWIGGNPAQESLKQALLGKK